MWREKLHEVDAIAYAIDARRASANGAAAGDDDDDAVAQLTQALVTFLDDADPLVAYAALRHLEQRAVVQRQHELLVELLLTTTSAPARHQWTASSGYRFQLLRALIQTNANSTAAPDTSDNESDEGEDDDDGASATATSASSHPGLRAVLKHTALLQSIALDLFQERGSESSLHPVHSTLAYELLGFLTDLTEQLTVFAATIEEDKESMMDLRGFDEFVKTMFRIFRSRMEYAIQPTYVSNAVVGVLRQFLRFQSASSRVSDGDDNGIKRAWLQRYLDLLVAERSPLTEFALELLRKPEPSEISSQASLISSESRFPFLQSWISFASSAVLALAQGSVDFGFSAGTTINSGSSKVHHHLPDRATLLAVMSEQDDVMVEVLHTLLQLTIFVESHQRQEVQSHEDGKFSKSVTWLVEYLVVQLDPDLLFADILRTFGHDHLVLLDLLISSETVMLEYLLRYLRRLGSNWEASRAVLCRQSSCSQTLDAVLGVFIRLRFEIDKQIAAGMFPYNAAPLLRRLVYVEELYEMA